MPELALAVTTTSARASLEAGASAASCAYTGAPAPQRMAATAAATLMRAWLPDRGMFIDSPLGKIKVQVTPGSARPTAPKNRRVSGAWTHYRSTRASHRRHGSAEAGNVMRTGLANKSCYEFATCTGTGQMGRVA